MVEVRHVLNEHATQMPLVQDQQVIQTVISDRSQPPLRDGVGLGRSERSADRCDAQVADPAMEGRSVAAVAVMHEKARWLTIPTASLDDLLARPLAGRMTRRSDMHDFATGVMNDEKDIDCPEEDSLDAKEVAGPDFAGMRGKKIAPARRRLSSMDASHVLRDGSGGDRDAQPCQLRLDPFLSPQEVLGRHATYEKLHVRRNRFASRSSCASRTPAPIGFPPLSVPSHDCSGSHDQKRLSPVWAPTGCQDPEPTILVP
jgi:hypothetical protein